MNRLNNIHPPVHPTVYELRESIEQLIKNQEKIFELLQSIDTLSCSLEARQASMWHTMTAIEASMKATVDILDDYARAKQSVVVLGALRDVE